jgi:hypothetical protein
VISRIKKTRFCTKNGPSRRPFAGFFTFSPNYSRQRHCRQSPSSRAKAGHCPAGNGHFPPRRASGLRGFFWFFCGRKGVPTPPQKNRCFGSRSMPILTLSTITIWIYDHTDHHRKIHSANCKEFRTSRCQHVDRGCDRSLARSAGPARTRTGTSPGCLPAEFNHSDRYTMRVIRKPHRL